MKLRTPSHATVVAYLALFVAIGGSAYAVSKIGSAQIENRSIKGKDVADEALGPRQVDEAKLAGPIAVGDATIESSVTHRRAVRLTASARRSGSLARSSVADRRDRCRLGWDWCVRDASRRRDV